ncbi:ribosome small subunit-dependent GTPase A [Aquibacillus sp. 3ASR75-11]|uniref:Small ribosomal subunit biogenesis GTPase RsgA n=1 Tax=Terrihalobacillus insolitus TaxID=2950438 RepID=A0A9X4AKS5_9BACI|nr:ribosome small subunit-dependent GTPase A [Terrihalobacillus insolitus]MDC3412899.1 ribosome small subunit-dependent GTPase A [Terrihalobacillus insolitus]MDC3423622.1 ribosome small subunit-dependent GTPase A [Terrihalobacillus insolitus]
MPEGKIVKALSGFYYVQTKIHIFQCRGRGVFRKNKVTPLVGDYVEFDESNPGEGYITKVKSRKNELVRPPIANIDQAIIVVSATKPGFSSLLLDRFLVLIESKQIEPVIFVSKMDLVEKDLYQFIAQYLQDYRKIGYAVHALSIKDLSELKSITGLFENKTSVIAGQSGVGKSSLLNAFNPKLAIETNEISESLGRGKHTTRHVELMEVSGGLVADTPGFSSLEFTDVQLEDLPNCFPEMKALEDACKFRGCMHNKEPKCAVKDAVKAGEIPNYRYDHYLSFYDEINNRKPRY